MEDKTLKMDSAKLFVAFRSDNLGEVTYTKCKELLWFFDKYAINTVGSREYMRYLQDQPAHTLLDRLTVSDIAYTVLVYENSEPVWNEMFNNRHSASYDKTAVPLYHSKRGTKLKEYTDGWTSEGCKYFDELKDIVKGWKTNEVFWAALKEHWREYAAENHKYVQVRKKKYGDEDHDCIEEEVEVEMLELSDEE